MVALLLVVVFLESRSVHAFPEGRNGDTAEDDRRRDLIVGGEEVSNKDDYPFFVNLGPCGGALIFGDISLTAAHVSAHRS